MTKTLLDGPGRVLESVYPRFLVDLAQGDDARLPQAHQQQFRERLMQELLSRVQLQTWTNGGMLNAPLSLRLTLVEKLASMLDPGHLALTQIAQHLALLQKMDHRQHSAFPELPQQIAALYEWFSARCRWKEKALTQRGLLVQAGEQSEQILPAGVLGRITPGRCLGAVLSFWRSCAGGHLAMPAVWEARKRWRCCWVICSRKRHNIWQRVSMRHRPRVTITISGLPLRPFRRAGSMLIF